MKNKTLRLILVLLLLLPAILLGSCAKANEGSNYAPSVGNPELGMDSDKLLSDDISASIPTERKIIKTYDINAETKEFDTTVAEISRLVAAHGGYVESNAISNYNYSSKMARYASYVIRIPAENADAFIGSVGNTLNVTRHTSNAKDVSESYYSIEATLEELQIERDSLLNMMESLDNQKDYNFWLTLQTRLSEVRQQIARYQAQLNNYDSRIEYSTVNLYINEVVNYTEESFGSRISTAFEEGLEGFCEFAEDFAIWVVEALPFLVLFAILLVIVCLVSRRARARRRAKKLAEKEALQK